MLVGFLTQIKYLTTLNNNLHIQIYAIINKVVKYIILIVEMILSSKQSLLISSPSSPQFFLFDPKTTAILHKYRQDSLTSVLAYYAPSQQLIAQQQGKTFLSVWSWDSQTVDLRISLESVMSCLQVSSDGGYLYGGGVNGLVYLWEMPSGLLLGKKNTNSQEIKSIIQYNNNHLIIVSKTQVQLWSMSSILINQQAGSLKRYHSNQPIKQACHSRNILAILSSKTLVLLQYSQHSGRRDFDIIHKAAYQHAGGLAISKTSVYVGDHKGGIDVIDLSIGQGATQTLSFALKQGIKQLEINRPKKKRSLVGKTKSPVTALAFVQTLAYLVAGHQSGEVVVWHNSQIKKSLQLFKSTIFQLKVIPKPQQIKISQNNKIRPLHKYQMSKQQQPLDIIPSQQIQSKNIVWNAQDEQKDILSRMMQAMNNPVRMLAEENVQLKQNCKSLLESNLRYFNLFNP